MQRSRPSYFSINDRSQQAVPKIRQIFRYTARIGKTQLEESHQDRGGTQQKLRSEILSTCSGLECTGKHESGEKQDAWRKKERLLEMSGESRKAWREEERLDRGGTPGERRNA